MLQNMKELTALLGQVKTIAIVGAVDKPGRPVDRVGRSLMDMGFKVIPVHPVRKEVWGLQTYPSITEVPDTVDVVDLFRNAQFCPAHAQETLDMPVLPKIFWMQSGIQSPEAREILTGSGVTVVEDLCLMVEMARMRGNE